MWQFKVGNLALQGIGNSLPSERRRCYPGPQDDGRSNLVADLLVENAEDTGFFYNAELKQRVLKFAGNDQNTLAFEAIVRTAEYRHVAVAVHRREVIGEKPSIAFRSVCLLFVAEIFQKETGIVPMKGQSARSSRGLRSEILIEDFWSCPPRYADRARPFGHARRVPKDHLRLGHAEMLPNGAFEATLPFFANGRLERLAGGIHTSQGRDVETFLDAGLTQNPPVKRCDTVQKSDAIARDRRENALGTGPFIHDRASHTVPQREEHVVTERADETPFARCERNVVCLRRNTRAIAVTKRFEPTVSVDDSLGPSCGPRSEDDKRGIVRLRLMHGRNGDGIVNDRRTIASQKLRSRSRLRAKH